MAKKPSKSESEKTRRFRGDEGELLLGRKNYVLMSVGLLLICLGYIRLRQGSITDAPLLLVLGYCVVIPLAIVLRP